MANKITPILIDGKNEINGGKIYNAELNINSDRASEVKISVVAPSSEKYSYSTPKIGQPKKITIGNLELNNMYNYKYSYKSSTNGSFLELYYKDWTWILDKYWVGLQGKHGWTKKYLDNLKDQAYIEVDQQTNLPKNYYERLDKRMKDIRENKEPNQPSGPRTDIYQQQDNLLIIGRLFHPCDKDKNNIINPKEMGYDKCDPCPSCPDDKYDTKCFEYTETKIFETAYSFKDLIDFLPKVSFSNGVKDFTIKKPNEIPSLEFTGYFKDYHGPLREVLTSWANDFGLSLYADITKESFEISFLDTKGLAAKENSFKDMYENYIKGYSQKNKLISYEKEQTIENTIKLGSITWYEREGERKNFDCTKSQAISLSPLFGVDLLGNRYRAINGAGKTSSVNGDDDIASSILSKYNPIFREAFWFRQIYGIKDQDAALSMMIDPDQVSAMADGDQEQESDDAIADLGMREIGNLTILSVVNTGIDVSQSDNKFHKLANANWNTLYNSLSEKEQQEYSLNNGFFIVGYHDDDAFQKTLKIEDQLFDFLGRFFIREHMGRLCGITGTEEFVKQNTHINTPDGSAQIYTKSEGLQGSPLAKYKYYTSGYLGCVAPTKKTDVGNNNAWKKDPKLVKEESWGGYGSPMSTQGLNFNFSPMDGSKTNSKGNPIIGYHDSSTVIPDSYLAGDSSYASEVKGNSIPNLFTQSTILLEREPKWYPSVEEYKQTYRSTIDKNTPLHLLQLKMLGLDGDPASSSWKNYPIYVASGVFGPNFEKIKVFLVYPGEFELKCKAKDKGHPEEVSIWKKKMKQVISPRPGGKFKSEYPLGLLGDRFHHLTPKIKVNQKMFEFPEIYTPPYTFWQVEPDFSSNFSRQKDMVKKMTSTSLCDSHLRQEIPREAGFRVSIEQKFSQTVVVPKIQTGLYGDIANEDGTLKYDIKYNLIENEDFEAYSGYKGYGCVPNFDYLQNIHKAYTGLSVSVTGASPGVRIDFKGLPENLNTFFTDFGQSLTMNLSDNGIIGTIQYSTKNAKMLSEDLIKWKRRNNSI
jgi:hypothetical protein